VDFPHSEHSREAVFGKPEKEGNLRGKKRRNTFALSRKEIEAKDLPRGSHKHEVSGENKGGADTRGKKGGFKEKELAELVETNTL